MKTPALFAAVALIVGVGFAASSVSGQAPSGGPPTPTPSPPTKTGPAPQLGFGPHILLAQGSPANTAATGHYFTIQSPNLINDAYFQEYRQILPSSPSQTRTIFLSTAYGDLIVLEPATKVYGDSANASASSNAAAPTAGPTPDPDSDVLDYYTFKNGTACWQINDATYTAAPIDDKYSVIRATDPKNTAITIVTKNYSSACPKQSGSPRQ